MSFIFKQILNNINTDIEDLKLEDINNGLGGAALGESIANISTALGNEVARASNAEISNINGLDSAKFIMVSGLVAHMELKPCRQMIHATLIALIQVLAVIVSQIQTHLKPPLIVMLSRLLVIMCSDINYIFQYPPRLFLILVYLLITQLRLKVVQRQE